MKMKANKKGTFICFYCLPLKVSLENIALATEASIFYSQFLSLYV